jgi:hypothetical protein
MNQQAARFIPSSLLRIRRFLGERCSTKIKPWATAEETLDAFHDLIASKKEDEEFWKDLELLLGCLAGDMKKRMKAPDGGVTDNEALDPARHRLLLSELRQKLDGRRAGRGRFRALASALSMPALGLLLVLGGAVTAGCYSSTAPQDEDATSDISVDESRDDLRHDPVVDPAIDQRPDPLPDPITDPVPEEVACAHAGETVEEIINACITDPEGREEYLQCISQLHGSWRTGLTEYLQCMNCEQVAERLGLCLYFQACEDPASQGEFDLEEFLDNCSVYIYIGVRFE